tara:strand:+ start:6840 stop:7811 length:972 start_codon:yes stop_codon:yes gene_type:complete
LTGIEIKVESNQKFLERKNVLVTGGAGFIGSHLIESIQSAGSITVVDDFSSGRKENIDTSKIKLIEQDVNSFPEDILKDIDVVFHLAAIASVPKSNEDPLTDFKVNAHATLRLLELIRKNKADITFFYPSTALVHGESNQEKISEETDVKPISFYGLSKYAGEHYVKLYSDIYGLKTKIARFFNVYGPRQHTHVIFDTLQKIASNPKHLSMLGTGKETRDFVFVKDVVSATLAFLDSPSSEKIINVGSGDAIPIEQLVSSILRLCNITDCKVDFSQKSWKGDVMKYRADNSKLNAFFKPAYSLDEGLRETIQWFENSYQKITR